MTVAVTRTKAEQAYSETFEAVAAKLPGGRAVADARKAAIGAFAGLGFPHRRIEEWKYTDLRAALKEALPPAIADATPVTVSELQSALEGLAALDAHRVVFVNGAHRPDLSTAGAENGLEIGPLAAALGQSAGDTSIRPGAPGLEAVIALNTAFVTDGALIRIGKGASLAKPVLLVLSAPARRRISSPRATASGWATARAPRSSRRMYRCRVRAPARPTR